MGEAVRPATIDSVTVSEPFAAYRPVWRRPNSLPCRQDDGSNPCWDGDDIFAQALAAGQSSQATLTRLREDFAADRFTAGEICDGDVVSNSGARNGRAFYIPVEEVAFDEKWLVDRDLEHRKLPDGRICIPSRSYGDWHYVFACGNAVQVLSRPATAADRRRVAAAPLAGTPVAWGAASSPGFFGGGFGGSGSGTDAAPSPGEIIDVITNPPDRPVPGGPDTPPGPPPQPTPPSDGPPPTPPPSVVPTPPAILFMLTALGALISFRRKKPATD